MENKRLFKFLAVAAFTITIQLISVYVTPDNNQNIVSEEPTDNKTSSIVSLNDLKDNKY